MTPLRRDDVRRAPRCRTPRRSACRCAGRSRQLDRVAARRDEAARALRPRPALADVLVTGGSLGAQRLNTAFEARVAALRAAGVQVLHLTGAGKEFEPSTPRAPARPTSSSPYADRMDLAYAAADLVVCAGRREHGLRADRRRPAGGLRPAADRQRRAAVQRRRRRGRRWRPPRRRRGVDPGLDRRARSSPCCPTASASTRWRAAAAASGSAAPTSCWPTWSSPPTPQSRARDDDERRQRPLRLHRPPSLRWRSSASVHFIAIGGAGHVRRGPGHAGPGLLGERLRRQASRRSSPRSPPRAPTSTSATTPPTSRARTPSSSPRRSASPTSSCVAARARGPAGAAPLAGAGRHDGRLAPGRGRRRQRQDDDDLDAHRRAPALRRRPVVRGRRRAAPSTAPTPTGAPATCSWRRPTRATARSSSTGPRSRSSPTSSPTTSTSTAPSTEVQEAYRRVRRHDASRWAARRLPGRRGLARAGPGWRGLPGTRVLTYGWSTRGRRRAARARSFRGLMGRVTRHRTRTASSAPCGSTCPGGTTCSTPPPPTPRPSTGSARTRPACSTGCSGSPAPGAGSSPRARPRVSVVDDYAHNPGKVAAVVTTGRRARRATGRLVVVFQPHLYSRTRDFAGEFAAALLPADVVVLMEVYAAREDPMPGVSVPARRRRPARAASGRRRRRGLLVVGGGRHVVAGLARAGDLVLTVGAGDVTMIGPEILRALGR